MLAQPHAKMSILSALTLAMGKGGCQPPQNTLILGRIDCTKQFPNCINRQNSYMAPKTAPMGPNSMPPPPPQPPQTKSSSKKKKKRRRRRKKKQQTSQTAVARQRHCSEDSITIVFEDEADSSLDSSSDSLLSTRKKVRFAEDLCQVHTMIAWSFAYQAARRGPWEECMRDRWRFQRRIKDTEVMLAVVLNPQHRQRIYEERFEESSWL